jgi:hypothetical protein
MPPCIKGGGTAPAPSPPAPAPAPYSDATCSTGILHYVSGVHATRAVTCMPSYNCFLMYNAIVSVAAASYLSLTPYACALVVCF